MSRLIRDNIDAFLPVEKIIIGDRPVFSIVIPTRFRDEHLENCMEAIENNTVESCEILIVRDESKNRVGCPNATSIGVCLCTHDNIVFIGNDTLPQPGWEVNALELMSSFPDAAGMVGFNDTVTDYEEKPDPQHFMINKEIIKKLPNRRLFYHYAHNYCDTELYHRVSAMGLYKMCDSAIVYHIHHAIAPEGHEPREPDECDLYAWQSSSADDKTFKSRIL